jgi:hypothetical protein
MRDPHIDAVYYEIGTGDGISFGAPPTMTVTNRLGTFELSNGKLSIRPTEHYSSGNEARAVLEPFLRAWEVDSDLTRNIGSIRFKFLSVHKVDRSPPVPDSGLVSIAVGAAEVIAVGEVASVHITQNTYPPPPGDFRTTPEVELAYSRWRAFREGREPLQSMSYAVLTLLESTAGNRRHAASTFHVDANILSTIGRLSSTKGDGATVRKFGAGGQLQPLSGPESSWLEAAVRRLVRRIGEHAAGVQLSQLTMRDLPRL